MGNDTSRPRFLAFVAIGFLASAATAVTLAHYGLLDWLPISQQSAAYYSWMFSSPIAVRDYLIMVLVLALPSAVVQTLLYVLWPRMQTPERQTVPDDPAEVLDD